MQASGNSSHFSAKCSFQAGQVLSYRMTMWKTLWHACIASSMLPGMSMLRPRIRCYQIVINSDTTKTAGNT